MARGEFSIVIAGLAGTAGTAGVQPEPGPFATAYVLVLVVTGPLTARYAEPIAARLTRGRVPSPSALHTTESAPRPGASQIVDGADERGTAERA